MVRKYLIAIVVIFLVLSVIGYVVFNGTVSSPKSVSLLVPKQETTPESGSKALAVPGTNPANLDKAITVFLLKANKVYAYEGKNRNGGKVWNLSSIGELLSKEKQAQGDSATVIIKPSRFGTYQNTIDLLDRITENNIKNYVLLDVTKEEEDFIEKKQQEESK